MIPRVTIALFFMLSSLQLFSQDYNKKLINPHPDVDKIFPIMAWDYVGQEAEIRDMHEAGVNVIAFVPPELLDACQHYDMRAIIFDERVTGAFDAPYDAKVANPILTQFIKKYNEHPAVYGYHLKDEPGPDQFPELAKSVALVKKLAPGKWPYINLLPTQVYGDAYERYLEDFATICKPTAFSYDNYSQDYAINGGAKSLFWKNLTQVREAALKYDLPFWNIVLTAPHFSYAEQTDADLRLQVYGSLVYGAKGLSYYKFISAALPILAAPDLGNFRNAPLDQFGERTPTWDIIRNINRQVHSIGAVLMKLRSDDVYHIGEVPELDHAPTATTLVKDVPNGAFIVGDFTHEDGSRYVMVVNKSLTNSFPCNPVFNDEPKSIKLLSSWKGTFEDYPTPWYWLAPGQGVLLKLEY